LHSIYGCVIHLTAAIWSSVTHLLLHLGKPIKTKKKDEEEQQPEILPMTEEPRPTHSSAIEHHRSAYDISAIDEKRDYIKLHKYCINSKAAYAKCSNLRFQHFLFRGKMLRPPHLHYQHLTQTLRYLVVLFGTCHHLSLKLTNNGATPLRLQSRIRG